MQKIDHVNLDTIIEFINFYLLFHILLRDLIYIEL